MTAISLSLTTAKSSDAPGLSLDVLPALEGGRSVPSGFAEALGMANGKGTKVGIASQAETDVELPATLPEGAVPKVETLDAKITPTKPGGFLPGVGEAGFIDLPPVTQGPSTPGNDETGKDLPLALRHSAAHDGAKAPLPGLDSPQPTTISPEALRTIQGAAEPVTGKASVATDDVASAQPAEGQTAQPPVDGLQAPNPGVGAVDPKSEAKTGIATSTQAASVERVASPAPESLAKQGETPARPAPFRETVATSLEPKIAKTQQTPEAIATAILTPQASQAPIAAASAGVAPETQHRSPHVSIPQTPLPSAAQAGIVQKSVDPGQQTSSASTKSAAAPATAATPWATAPTQSQAAPQAPAQASTSPAPATPQQVATAQVAPLAAAAVAQAAPADGLTLKIRAAERPVAFKESLGTAATSPLQTASGASPFLSLATPASTTSPIMPAMPSASLGFQGDSVAEIAALVDRLSAARDNGGRAMATVALAHKELGPLSLTFESNGRTVDVEVAARDNETQRSLAAALAVRSGDMPAPTATQTAQPTQAGQAQANAGGTGGERGFAQADGDRNRDGSEPQPGRAAGQQHDRSQPGTHSGGPESDGGIYA